MIALGVFVLVVVYLVFLVGFRFRESDKRVHVQELSSVGDVPTDGGDEFGAPEGGDLL